MPTNGDTQFPIGDNHLNNHTNNVLAMILQSCKHKKTRNSCRIKYTSRVASKLKSSMSSDFLKIVTLLQSSKKLSNRRRKHSNQPGWNDHVADLHKDARECFVMWCNNGKPRQGWIFDLMHQTRSQFKYALRTVNMNSTLIGTRGKNTTKCLAAWKSVFTV